MTKNPFRYFKTSFEIIQLAAMMYVRFPLSLRNVEDWLTKVGIKPLRIYPGSPWENEYNERFNGTLRREILNAEWFISLHQAQTVFNTWLRKYNRIRPHQALGMRPPVPETLLQSGT